MNACLRKSACLQVNAHSLAPYSPEPFSSTSFQLGGKVFRPVHPEGEVDGQWASDSPEFWALSEGGSFNMKEKISLPWLSSMLLF